MAVKADNRAPHDLSGINSKLHDILKDYFYIKSLNLDILIDYFYIKSLNLEI